MCLVSDAKITTSECTFGQPRGWGWRVRQFAPLQEFLLSRFAKKYLPLSERRRRRLFLQKIGDSFPPREEGRNITYGGGASSGYPTYSEGGMAPHHGVLETKGGQSLLDYIVKKPAAWNMSYPTWRMTIQSPISGIRLHHAAIPLVFSVGCCRMNIHKNAIQGVMSAVAQVRAVIVMFLSLPLSIFVQRLSAHLLLLHPS